MADKELEITTNTYIFAGVGALILGGLAAAALGGLQNTIAAGVVGDEAVVGLSSTRELPRSTRKAERPKRPTRLRQSRVAKTSRSSSFPMALTRSSPQTPTCTPSSLPSARSNLVGRVAPKVRIETTVASPLHHQSAKEAT